jgi:adenosylmethionine-8-amino-7-oxononanoate aminotransferase
VILEPVQNAGGCFTPPEGYFQRVREICDEYDVLLISDEVICAWGGLGEWFGSQRYGYQPDMITTAKGLTSAYAPMGALIASDRVAEPFMRAPPASPTASRSPGTRSCSAIALANIDVFENEGILDNVRANEARSAHARIAARHPDRRRRARRRLLPGDRAGQGQGHEGVVQTTPSPRRCCAASSPASCSGAA